MDFCEKCGNLLVKSTENKLMLICTAGCTSPIPGPPESRLLYTKDFRISDSIEKYNDFLKVAAHLPTVLKVMKQCPKCKNAVTTMVRVTQKEKVIYLCECGYKWDYL